MCGIAGFTRYRDEAIDARSLLNKMGDAIRHRGPDGSDVYVSDKVGLCHRRLSIIELSDLGKQPMTSHSGRYVTVYNGEIYNFPQLRQSLERDGVQFRGNSDTEVLIELFEKKGLDCLGDLNGMFALAIWDTVEETLFLARDRLGKKPLYYYAAGDRFAFASEIKALLCLPGIDKTIREDAVVDYFYHQYVPDPKSIFKNVHKLMPGHWLKLNHGDLRQEKYWDVSFADQSRDSPEQLQEHLCELLDDSVKCRMISDVPLGAFLSGGVDSSAVVALMARNSQKPVTTCAIGFGSVEFDEVSYAAKVAQRFETDHHVFTVKENVEDNLREIAAYFDEPFCDPSFVPTYFVSRLARRKVTVALAGDGGDENFAGYSKYLADRQENRLRGLFPRPLRRSVFPALGRILGSSGVGLARRGGSLLNSLAVDADEGFFISNSFFRPSIWNSLVTDSFQRATTSYSPAEITRSYYAAADTDDHLSKILYTDIKSYLPGDILVKVDRMSMANSLETRAPILDYRVVEFAASIPSALKIQGNETKYLLKKSFEDTLSMETLYRKKMGFSVPLAQWLRKEINGIAEHHLLAKDNGLSNYFDTTKIRDIWNLHQSGSTDYSQELWSLLVFELWWQSYIAE